MKNVIRLFMFCWWLIVSSISQSDYCASLNLTDNQCLIECQYYNNINLYYGFIENTHSNLSLLTNSFIAEMNMTYNDFNETLFNETLRWFTLSSYPFEYYGNIQPDVCLYSLGTYCNIKQNNDMMHGCCIPTHCSDDNAIKLIKSNIPCFQNYDEHIKGTKTIICSILPRKWTVESIMLIIMFCLLLIFIAISTIIQYKNNHDNPINILFWSFCLQRNWNSFTHILSENEWAFCNGLRIICAYHIVYFHLQEEFLLSDILVQRVSVIGDQSNWLYPQSQIDNSWANYIRSKFFYLISVNLSSMLTFFWMAGFFGIRSMIKILTKWKYKRNYSVQSILIYIKRYFRLMVIFAVVQLFNMYIYDQIPYSYNVTSRDSRSNNCKQVWYKELLLYNIIYRSHNWHKTGDPSIQCVNNSWYVFADFYLYLYLPLICFVWIDTTYIYGFIATSLPMITCIIIRLYMGFYHNFTEIPYDWATDGGGRNFWASYQLPWSWMIYYYMGSLFGLILLYVNDKYHQSYVNFRLNRNSYWFLMGMSLLFLSSYVCTPYSDFYDYPEKKWSETQTVFYYALAAISDCIGLTIFVFSLRFLPNNYYSMVKTFLSCDLFQMLSKLTYTIFLIHKPILQLWKINLNYPINFSVINILGIFISFIVLITFISFCIYMFIEGPISFLITKIWKNCIIPKYSKPNSLELLNPNEMMMDEFIQHKQYGTNLTES